MYWPPIGKCRHRARYVRRQKIHDMFLAWVRGESYEELSKRSQLPVEHIRSLIKEHVRQLVISYRKWKKAEARCRALGMELRLLRLNRGPEPDRPIETLNPPTLWLKAFRQAGIDTVHKLRTVSEDMLLSSPKFPRRAIDWAVMTLDMLGYSHCLRRPRFESRLR
jgi:hypothetical protein